MEANHAAQGGVNLILNMDQEGFAHSHYLTHGPVLGIWVSDASAQTARAQALLAQVHRQLVEAGELAIPLIRGVDGLLVYFLDHGDTLSFFSFGK